MWLGVEIKNINYEIGSLECDDIHLILFLISLKVVSSMSFLTTHAPLWLLGDIFAGKNILLVENILYQHPNWKVLKLSINIADSDNLLKVSMPHWSRTQLNSEKSLFPTQQIKYI